DGCLMEGISEEAAELAGHLKLKKLIVFWDNNNITIDGTVKDASSTDERKRFEAMGWNTIGIDGHDVKAIEQAIVAAQKSDKPTLIACSTTIGFGAPNKAGTSKVHGSPLGEEETSLMRQNLNWPYAPFEVPEDVLALWREAGARHQKTYEAWLSNVSKEFEDYISDVLPLGWNNGLESLKQKAIDEAFNIASRKSSQLCLEEIVKGVPQIIGGSADLAASNLTLTGASKTITAADYAGNNIKYGIREHAMGAVMNGLSLHGGVIPFGGTFFVFSDYMRPSIRLAALMGLRVIYVLTHDSIGVGEDGPTHQPIEHLASYRAMPNILVFRPCDTVETAEAYETAVMSSTMPSMLVLSRQNLPVLRKSAKENLTSKGAYVISAAEGKRDVTLIATGSEVMLAVKAQEALKQQGIHAAVVSMPCQELFDKQDKAYQKEVLGDAPKIAIEAASTFGWHKYADDVIGIDSFGASGKADAVYTFFGITVDEILKRVAKLVK
ncbi:MAG: transketolase, partial [Alphaproteobacteria bacterium]|nr:transketolase [Alphaproteobacteria bacterium]